MTKENKWKQFERGRVLLAPNAVVRDSMAPPVIREKGKARFNGSFVGFEFPIVDLRVEKYLDMDAGTYLELLTSRGGFDVNTLVLNDSGIADVEPKLAGAIWSASMYCINRVGFYIHTNATDYIAEVIFFLYDSYKKSGTHSMLFPKFSREIYPKVSKFFGKKHKNIEVTIYKLIVRARDTEFITDIQKFFGTKVKRPQYFTVKEFFTMVNDFYIRNGRMDRIVDYVLAGNLLDENMIF